MNGKELEKKRKEIKGKMLEDKGLFLPSGVDKCETLL